MPEDIAAPVDDVTASLVADLVADLVAERAELTAVLGTLSDAQWATACPTQTWTIADQVGHLAFFDEVTARSITDPDGFLAERDRFLALGPEAPDRIVEQLRGTPGPVLLDRLRQAQAELVAAYRDVDPAVRLPWFGPDMRPASSVSARLMETWAHGQDVHDALGITRVPTARLRHVAHIGVGARAYSYLANGESLPTDPIRVELAAPGGGTWAWGPEDAADRVTGTALDFCLLVTQRRNPADVAVATVGPAAAEWISLAQAFAGAAGTGRAPMNEWTA